MTARLPGSWPSAGCLVAATIACGALDPRGEAPIFVAVALVWAALACGAAWSLRGARELPRGIWIAAVLLRAAALALPLSLSDDAWRYLWEGRVQLAGFDPFLYAPDAPELAGLRDRAWEQVNHRGVSTIYPPIALHLFAAVAAVAAQPLSWKLLAGIADLLLLRELALLVRGRAGRAWAPAAYALHPLPVLESAGSGHLEAIALLALVIALRTWDRGRPRAAGIALALGAGVKLLPVVAGLPMLRDRRAWPGLGIGAALLGLAALPFLAAGPALLRGMSTYYEAWAFNAALFPVLEAIAGDPAGGRVLGVVVGAITCGIAALRLRDPARFALFVAAALILLSPVVHPWYVLWALVPALCVGAWPWLVLASTTLLAYLVLGTLDPVTGAWSEAGWVRWLEYPPLALAALWWWRHRRPPWSARPPSAAPGSSSSPTPPARSTSPLR